jgi:uncharacterized protein YggE
MSNAWETTADDVLNVIHQMGKKATSEQVDAVLNNLDHFDIENAALRGDDMDVQTQYAYEEIKRQITEDELI